MVTPSMSVCGPAPSALASPKATKHTVTTGSSTEAASSPHSGSGSGSGWVASGWVVSGCSVGSGRDVVSGWVGASPARGPEQPPNSKTPTAVKTANTAFAGIRVGYSSVCFTMFRVHRQPPRHGVCARTLEAPHDTSPAHNLVAAEARNPSLTACLGLTVGAAVSGSPGVARRYEPDWRLSLLRRLRLSGMKPRLTVLVGRIVGLYAVRCRGFWGCLAEPTGSR